MLELTKRWAPVLTSQPETGMGYQIATIVLKDGRRFAKSVIVGGCITKIADKNEIPFVESDIESIVVDHGR
jgi:hypothetical protein